jgi:hypothetical protein
MKINGKTDASNGAGDIETQTLLGHLPLIAAGRVDRVAVVGFGSGMTAGAVLTHPVREVDEFEIEPAVVEASGYFDEINGRPLDDPRLRFVMGDARSERPISFSFDDMNQRFGDPAVRASLGEAFVRYPADLLVKLRLDERGTKAFAGTAPFNTDDSGLSWPSPVRSTTTNCLPSWRRLTNIRPFRPIWLPTTAHEPHWSSSWPHRCSRRGVTSRRCSIVSGPWPRSRRSRD